MGHGNTGARGITPAPPLLPPPCLREWCTERRPHSGMDWERRANGGNRRGSEDGSGHTPPASCVSTTPRRPPYKIPAHPPFKCPARVVPHAGWRAQGGMRKWGAQGSCTRDERGRAHTPFPLLCDHFPTVTCNRGGGVAIGRAWRMRAPPCHRRGRHTPPPTPRALPFAQAGGDRRDTPAAAAPVRLPLCGLRNPLCTQAGTVLRSSGTFCST